MSNQQDPYLYELLNILEETNGQSKDREQTSIEFVKKLKEVPEELLKYLPLLPMTEFVYNSGNEVENGTTFIFQKSKEILIEEERTEIAEDKLKEAKNGLALLDKIENQFKLANFQKLAMDELSKKYAHEVLGPIQEIAKTLSEKQEELDIKQKEFDEKQSTFDKKQTALEKRQKNSQRDFVAVLGLFTTIIFAAFGGLQLLAEVFKGLDSVPLDVSLIHGSFVFISLVLVLALLFSGLSRMSDLPIRSCDCDKTNRSCNCSFARKHPTVFFSLLLVSVIVSFAIVDKYFVFRDLLDGAISLDKGVEWGRLGILTQIAIVCSLPAFILITLNYVHKYFKNYFHSKIEQ